MTDEGLNAFMWTATTTWLEKMRRSETGELWEALLGPVPTSWAERSRFELQPEPAGGWQKFWQPTWSCDNPSIHGGIQATAIWRGLRLMDADPFPLPAHSSDIHEIVAHGHACLIDAFSFGFIATQVLYSAQCI